MVAILALLAALGAPAPAQGDMGGMSMPMTGMYGSYPMSREGSGTAWQPEATPVSGVSEMAGEWMVMLDGYADAVYDRQGGPRGAAKLFSESMGMAMAQRPLWDGTLGLRGMASLDPAMGPSGYPLLFQTGETADGVNPLVDRQHPHDLIMELAATYSHALWDDASAFAYFGLPGEPALGPVTFMHRFSGMDDPEAPITHHWLDSTHVTEGVATLGGVWRGWKLEGSAFRGREPDQYRWDVEKPGFDSYSARLSFNPTENWALQASYGRLVSPEALTPAVDQRRLTASASYDWTGLGAPAQTTFAWGRNVDKPGNTLDAFLLESAIRFPAGHTVFARLERVDKDELFQSGPLAGAIFTVDAVSAGYIYDFARWRHSSWGVGGVGSVYPLAKGLRAAYGPTPGSFMLFLRVKAV